MKICVLGNSHVAAIKHGYDLIKQRPHPPQITFFAIRGPHIAKLEVVGNVLKPSKKDIKLQQAINNTSDGLAEVDPAAYDQFLIVGLTVRIDELVETVNRPISSGALQCAIQDYWRPTALTTLINKLRSITDKPISVGMSPLVSAAKNNNDDASAYEQLVAMSNSVYFNNLNAKIIGQPPATIVNGRNSKQEFSKDSVRFSVDEVDANVKHPEGESFHMNQNYGELWLNNWLNTIRPAEGF